MVLDIPGKLLGQSDVRETPASSSSANAFTFDTDDFTNVVGAISLKNKTSYLTVPPTAFTTATPDVDDVSIDVGEIISNAASIQFRAPAYLPNGAVVTGVILYGNISDETWALYQVKLTDGTAVSMATAVFNTEDTSITNATIDNSLYSYNLATSGIDSTDKIYGARITYTTDYI